MVRVPPAPARPQRPLRAPFGVPELTLPGDFALPFRQDLRVPIGGWGDLAPQVVATLEEAGYWTGTLRPGRRGKAPASVPPPVPSIVIAERRRRPIRMLRPMQVSIWALFGAGLVLGAFDTVAVGNPVVLIPWMLVAAGIAGLFWYRWGRSYVSDVVVVSWHPSGGPGGGDPTSTVPLLVWWGGRVRSDIRGGSRTAVRAEYVTELAGELGSMTRSLSSRLAAAGLN